MHLEIVERGQTMVEFVILTLVVGLVLVIPWIDGRSPAELLEQAIVGRTNSVKVWLTWF